MCKTIVAEPVARLNISDEVYCLAYTTFLFLVLRQCIDLLKTSPRHLLGASGYWLAHLTRDFLPYKRLFTYLGVWHLISGSIKSDNQAQNGRLLRASVFSTTSK